MHLGASTFHDVGFAIFEKLPLEEGKWFICKFCRNPKDTEGKFGCRTPFSSEQITSVRAGHCAGKAHKEKKAAQTPITALLAPKNESSGSASVQPAAEPEPQAQPETEQKAHKICHGLGFEVTDKDQDWPELYKAYLYFIQGAPKASTKFMVEASAGTYTSRATDCAGIGLKWQHRVQCCKQCHAVRTDPNNVAKSALLKMDKFLYALALLSHRSLTKADLSYLKHCILERPSASGTEAFHRLKDAAQIRVQLETSSQKMPLEFKGTSGETLFNLVLQIYGQGKAAELENSVVHHMMLNLLQKLAGKPHPHISAKLFALGRVMRHLHKPTYEFFRLNALVGPHVDTIKKAEAKQSKADQELVILRTPDGTQ